MRLQFRGCLWLLLPFLTAGCIPGSAPRTEPDASPVRIAPSRDAGADSLIAVSNSYLGVAVLDILERDTPLMLLAEPGMCPGHFDLRPSQLQQLRSSRLLLRFDFQQSLDARLGDSGPSGPRVPAVQVPGGMCVPDSYQAVCTQVADALSCDGHLSHEQAEKRVTEIARRLDGLNAWTAERVDLAGLRGAPVLCSGHQAAFCRYLGLEVIATFSSADTARPSQIDRAVKAGEQGGVRWIVANLPEGRQLADALGSRLQAPVVVFGNFPQKLEPGAFEQLVRDNLEALVRTAGEMPSP